MGTVSTAWEWFLGYRIASPMSSASLAALPRSSRALKLVIKEIIQSRMNPYDGSLIDLTC